MPNIRTFDAKRVRAAIADGSAMTRRNDITNGLVQSRVVAADGAAE